MSKDYTHIKANGLRNELKDLVKVTKQQTLVLEELASLMQAYLVRKLTHDEESINSTTCCRFDDDCECKRHVVEKDTYKKYNGKESGKSFGI